MADIQAQTIASPEDGDAVYGVTRIGEAFVGIPIDFLSEVCQVSALQQMLVRSAYLKGGFDLRGRLIPVIDLQRICDIEDPPSQPGFAVILRRDDQLMAFLVDEVVGITQMPRESLQTLQQATRSPGCLAGVVLEGKRLISVVDVPAIFDLPGIFSVRVPPVMHSFVADADRHSMLTFAVGGARFSVQAVAIYGTVPRQTIEKNAMTSGFCLGAITYHGRRIPVLSTVDILGIGQPAERINSEVVILRFPHDQLLGLAVDSIQDIRTMDSRKLSAVPKVIALQNNYLSGVHVTEDGSQIYVIDTQQMIDDAKVAAIASLSSEAPAESKSAMMDGVVAGNTRRISERYLIFHAGRAIAVPLEQVTCIIPTPQMIVPTHLNDKGLVGYFPRTRDSIPLVDLNAHLGLPAGAPDNARVLLTGVGTGQIGFQVERIYGIETSTWLLRGMTSDGPGSETMVQLGSGDSKRVLPTIDLAMIAADHF